MKEIYQKIAQDLFYVEYEDFDFDTSVQVTNENTVRGGRYVPASGRAASPVGISTATPI